MIWITVYRGMTLHPLLGRKGTRQEAEELLQTLRVKQVTWLDNEVIIRVCE